jgi:hypothetical protein
MASDPILADGPGRLRVRRWPPTPAVPAIRLLRTAQLLRESRSPCQEPFPFSLELVNQTWIVCFGQGSHDFQFDGAAQELRLPSEAQIDGADDSRMLREHLD